MIMLKLCCQSRVKFRINRADFILNWVCYLPYLKTFIKAPVAHTYSPKHVYLLYVATKRTQIMKHKRTRFLNILWHVMLVDCAISTFKWNLKTFFVLILLNILVITFAFCTLSLPTVFNARAVFINLQKISHHLCPLCQSCGTIILIFSFSLWWCVMC